MYRIGKNKNAIPFKWDISRGLGKIYPQLESKFIVITNIKDYEINQPSDTYRISHMKENFYWCADSVMSVIDIRAMNKKRLKKKKLFYFAFLTIAGILAFIFLRTSQTTTS